MDWKIEDGCTDLTIITAISYSCTTTLHRRHMRSVTFELCRKIMRTDSLELQHLKKNSG